MEKLKRAKLTRATIYAHAKAKAKGYRPGAILDYGEIARHTAARLARLGLSHLSVADQPHYAGTSYPFPYPCPRPPKLRGSYKVMGIDMADIGLHKVPYVPLRGDRGEPDGGGGMG